jgi:hypothetical protein
MLDAAIVGRTPVVATMATPTPSAATIHKNTEFFHGIATIAFN